MSLGLFAVELFVNGFEVRVRYMSVDLSCSNVRVAQHGLHTTQVGAVHQQIGSETVAQGVGRNMLGDTGQQGIAGNHTLDTSGRQSRKITAVIHLLSAAVSNK